MAARMESCGPWGRQLDYGHAHGVAQTRSARATVAPPDGAPCQFPSVAAARTARRAAARQADAGRLAAAFQRIAELEAMLVSQGKAASCRPCRRGKRGPRKVQSDLRPEASPFVPAGGSGPAPGNSDTPIVGGVAQGVPADTLVGVAAARCEAALGAVAAFRAAQSGAGRVIEKLEGIIAEGEDDKAKTEDVVSDVRAKIIVGCGSSESVRGIFGCCHRRGVGTV